MSASRSGVDAKQAGPSFTRRVRAASAPSSAIASRRGLAKIESPTQTESHASSRSAHTDISNISSQVVAPIMTPRLGNVSPNFGARPLFIAEPPSALASERSVRASMLRVLQSRWIRDANRRTIDECDDRVERVAIKSSQRFVRDVAEMRANEYVVHRAERMVGSRRLDIENVDSGTRDSGILQRRNQILFDHDRPARGVDQIRLGLHQRELSSRDECARAIAQHHVNREYVGQLEEIVLLNAARADRSSGFVGKILTPRDHVHPECAAILGHALANPSEAQEPERAAGEDHANRAL